MFTPSKLEVPSDLADVSRFVGAGASVFIYSFLFVGVWVGFVAAAEAVLQFRCRSKCCIYVGFLKDSFELGANFWNIGDTDVIDIILLLVSVHTFEGEFIEKIERRRFLCCRWRFSFVFVFVSVIFLFLYLVVRRWLV